MTGLAKAANLPAHDRKPVWYPGDWTIHAFLCFPHFLRVWFCETRTASINWHDVNYIPLHDVSYSGCTSSPNSPLCRFGVLCLGCSVAFLQSLGRPYTHRACELGIAFPLPASGGVEDARLQVPPVAVQEILCRWRGIGGVAQQWRSMICPLSAG